MSSNTMVDHLGITFTSITENTIEATMPVDARTKQPMGLLHGGANVVLAETLGSVAASLTVNIKEKSVVGLEINANHIRSVREGLVRGVASPIHLGGSTQIWEIRIFNEAEKLTCISRLTMAILDKK
ncbi:hotdog fold thioesterase [Algoriphagus sp. C2-7]|uniref:Hotdog fold thioesterase n=2 Tax=Algoriphagus sediminis TaxID=3057113 RepID=A0ABT7Y835_9BACT|nr:hotdog fold thioesterase [Algoriphagus sediminis]MDN3202631.1 hotdog fold thioesterase [Algoriphagus sediminis]